MPGDELLLDLMSKVRRGESAAAYELVRRYESAIRVAVRTRLTDPALRRQFDSMDICQSVLASFFLRAAAGQYDLHNAAQLVALLTKMARNKLAMHARGHYQHCRDLRRVIPLTDGMNGLPTMSARPDQQVADRELLNQAFKLMNPQVRQIATSRANGSQWSDIADELGGTAESRRKQFGREMDQIAHSLQID